MADGQVLRARRVISAAGAATTYGRLLPEAVRARIDAPASLKTVPPSSAHISLYVGLDRTAEQLGLSRTNLWLYPDANHDANVMRFAADPEAALPVVYISFPSAKDPDFQRRYPGKATIEAITMAPYDWFRRWEDTAWGHRGEDYDALKARLQQRLLTALLSQCPQIEGHVSHVELSTPLSTRHFTNHTDGAIYGLAHTPERFADRALQPRTPVPGLYLTGSDVCTAGVMGATMGGVLTASCVLRRNMLSVALRGHRTTSARPESQAAPASA